jgi:superfamily II DNA or RNA helicase
MTYLNAIRFRKKMLHNLASNVSYSKMIKDVILKDENNKVLIFSEENAQVKLITDHLYYSKQHKDINVQKLKDFESGAIRELGSSKGLTLGLNINGANYGILESYVGSTTDQSQKKGRLHRLDKDDVATFILFVVKDTQTEKWAKKIIPGLNADYIEYFTNIGDLIKKL